MGVLQSHVGHSCCYGQVTVGALMTTLRTLDRVDLAGKRVLLRVDLNVPMRAGQVTDTTRIDQMVPTLREITEKGG